MAGTGELRRQLGVSDAVVIGAGSMIGAGVFAAWAPAARSAGTGLLIGLVIAGIVAFCNAASSAQLAAIHPESGGTYVYGRRQLNLGWGHLAGWGFVVGKTASCVAMALTVGAYVWPEQERTVAVAAIVAITAVNIGGLSRTVAVTRVLLVVSIGALALVVISGWTDGSADVGRITPIEWDAYGILQSAGFMFFAFAGYARIATLGEEVRDPEVTIPKAVPRALFAVLVIYAIVGVTALAVAAPEDLAATDAPLRLVAADSLAPLVRVGAAVAALGVLLNLIPGVSRTSLAMARNRELPPWFAHVDTTRALPLRAELTVAAVVIILIVLLDLRSAIAVSGVAILTYYAITNAAALTLTSEQRRWHPAIAVVGLIGCVVLVASLPPSALLGGGITLGLGVVVRAFTSGRGSGPSAAEPSAS
ncbi:MAG: APC family permease [Actinomycetota bacterium]